MNAPTATLYDGDVLRVTLPLQCYTNGYHLWDNSRDVGRSWCVYCGVWATAKDEPTPPLVSRR